LYAQRVHVPVEFARYRPSSVFLPYTLRDKICQHKNKRPQNFPALRSRLLGDVTWHHTMQDLIRSTQLYWRPSKRIGCADVC
jgi:hypothetical protein